MGGGGDNVHGEFGDATNWSQLSGTTGTATVADIVAAWITANRATIERTCDILLAYAATELR